MYTADFFQAVAAGICLPAGTIHMMIGLRSRPRNWVHLTFAVMSLLYGNVQAVHPQKSTITLVMQSVEALSGAKSACIR